MTSRKDLAPPLETIKKLDIQGYCEKSDNLDQAILLIESGIKSVSQMREIKKINNQLSKTNAKLEKAYLENIQTLRYTVEAKDSYTKGHSDRVSAYAVLLGKKIGLSKEDLKTLKIGGLFHDIGKIGIPDSILQKGNRLTDEEYEEIKKHTSIGVHILSNISDFKDVLPIIKYHHERFDGTGYPNGLSGEKIPYLARIVSIADCFDAMTSRRIYQNSLAIESVIYEFDRCKGTQFDPELTDIFIDILKNDYSQIEKIQKSSLES